MGSEEEQAEGADILDIEIRRGLSELQRPTTGLSLSGLSAGLDIGFGPLLMGVILTSAGVAGTDELTTELLLAIAYGVGFILVVLGRSELFTEHIPKLMATDVVAYDSMLGAVELRTDDIARQT